MATLLQTDQPGRIAGLRIAPASALAGKNRDLLLRIHWDDAEQPAVLCPAGDFFGYAWGRPAMQSLLVGTAADVDYCYFPMPFDKSRGSSWFRSGPRGRRWNCARRSMRRCRAAADEGKFYAVWRRENPTKPGGSFTFLETEGRGHRRLRLAVSRNRSGKTLFFEGMTRDVEAKSPFAERVRKISSTAAGTTCPVAGKALSFPLSGCLGYEKHLGRTGGYRLFLGDAYAFRQSGADDRARRQKTACPPTIAA